MTEAVPEKRKISLRKRTEKNRELLLNESQDEGDKQDDQDDHGEFLPHPRDRVVEADLRRGADRPFQSLRVEGREKRHLKTDKFTNYDRDQQLDYATRIFR